MADLTPAAFQAKWNQRFADNDTFNVDEQDLREFTADQLRTFVARAEQAGKTLQELVLPMPVVASNWYTYPTGIWEARGSFNAAAAPISGPNWRLVLAVSAYGDAQAVAAAVASNQFATRAGQIAAAVVYPASGGVPQFFATAQEAINAAYPEDRVHLRGVHTADINVIKTLDIDAYGATFTGQVVLCWFAWNTSALRTIWRGGTMRGNMFFGRSTLEPNKIAVHDVRFSGGEAYLHSHTNNTGNPLPNDEYSFYNCHITHVVYNQRTDSEQRQSQYFSGCSFSPASAGAVFRGLMHPFSVLTAHNCRFTATALFDTPAQLGKLQLHGLTNAPLEAGATNLLADGLRLLTSANPFAVPASAENVYPVGGGGGGGGTFGYRAAYDGSGRYSDAECSGPKNFAVQQLVNASGYTAQVLNPADGSAYGPQRTVAADVTADIAAAFATAPAPTLVLVRVSPTRVDAARVAYTYFTLA